MLVTHGVVNAINLDGGGSATVTYNDTVINYPSEHWLVSNLLYNNLLYISIIVPFNLRISSL